MSKRELKALGIGSTTDTSRLKLRSGTARSSSPPATEMSDNEKQSAQERIQELEQKLAMSEEAVNELQAGRDEWEEDKANLQVA